MFALHPLYLSLTALAPSGGMPGDLAKKIAEARTRLDAPAVDYEGTLAAKLAIARELFDRQGRQELEVGVSHCAALLLCRSSMPQRKAQSVCVCCSGLEFARALKMVSTA